MWLAVEMTQRREMPVGQSEISQPGVEFFAGSATEGHEQYGRVEFWQRCWAVGCHMSIVARTIGRSMAAMMLCHASLPQVNPGSGTDS